METTHVETTQTKGAALNSLAIVGFVALIIIGILATIYAASFIPKILSGSNGTNNTGAAYLSGLSDQSRAPNTVTATTTQPASTGTVTATPLTPTTTVTPTQPAPAAAPTSVTKTIYKYVTVPSYSSSGSSVSSYSGLPDLTVTITDRGYLRNGVGSFVSANSVPSGYQGAVKYRISNIGSNVSGSYRVDIRVDTNGGSNSDSVTGNSLAPGRSVEGTGSFDATNGGTATIRLTVDAGNNVSESNENNNSDSTTLALSGYNNASYTSSYNSSYNYNTNSYNRNTYTNTRNSSSYDSTGKYCTYGTLYSGGYYYCNTAPVNTYTTGGGNYDSTGSYCSYGTYQQSGQYYCRPNSSYSNSTGTNNYDSNGNYCSYGVYENANRFYCNSSNSNTNVYDNQRDSGCLYGSYEESGTYYCY